MIDWNNILISIITVIVAVPLTALVTYWISSKQFFKNQKYEFYLRIKEDLITMKNSTAGIQEILIKGLPGEKIREAEFGKAYRESLASIAKTAESGSNLISEKSITELKLLIKNLDRNSEEFHFKLDHDPVDYEGKQYDLIENCLKVIDREFKESLSLIRRKES